jgi:DNA-binding NarL/FixJ family response regulator
METLLDLLEAEAYRLSMSLVRMLVVDDYAPFCQLIRAMLQRAEFQVIGQASDGLEAVRKTQELQPDLILLDVSLPSLNGLETAKRIRTVAPSSKILFISQESDSDVVREALALGALGYVHKSRAQTELWPAIEAVLAGRQFVSSGMKGYDDAKSVIASHRMRLA